MYNLDEVHSLKMLRGNGTKETPYLSSKEDVRPYFQLSSVRTCIDEGAGSSSKAPTASCTRSIKVIVEVVNLGLSAYGKERTLKVTARSPHVSWRYDIKTACKTVTLQICI